LRIVVSLIVLCGLVLSAACQANPVDADPPPEIPPDPVAEPLSTSVPVSPTQGDSQMIPSLPVPADAGLQNLIDKAMADLAKRLSIPAVQITLVEATPVIWPDSSLGCPQPGNEYLQVPEDGLLIRLQAGEQIYEYHSGGFRDPFLCIKTDKDPNPPPQIDIFNLTPSNPKSAPDTSITPDNSIPPGENQ
jgi:hypothetical protein